MEEIIDKINQAYEKGINNSAFQEAIEVIIKSSAKEKYISKKENE